MTSGRRSAPPDPATGRRGWSLRSILAPAPFSRLLVIGLAVELALGALDVALGAEVLIAAVLGLPPLVVALTGRWGDTAVMAVVAVALVLLAPLASDGAEQAEQLVALALVAAAGAVGVAVALMRAGMAVTIERYRLLAGAAGIVDRGGAPDQLVDELLDLLVPAFGDIAGIDAVLAGAQRRLGTRCGDGVPEAAVTAIARRRRLGPDDPRVAEGAIASGHSHLTTDFGELLDAIARTPEDREAFASLGLRSLLVVPLRARGKVIGALTCVAGPSGRIHTLGDQRFADVLAGRIALALENAGLTSELSVAEEQLGAVVASLAEAVTVTDAEGRVVYLNATAVSLLGAESPEELLTSPPGEIMDRFAVYDEEGRPITLADLPGARMQAGEDPVEPMLVRNIVKATGVERWLLNKVSALRGPGGELRRIVNVIEDVTEVKRAERAQRLLAQASEGLASSLDPVDELQRLVDLLVPRFADSASVHMPGPRGRVERVAAAGPEIDSGSVLRVPLQAGSETLGTLRLAHADPSRGFGEEDRALAEELGRRAGVAVLNARAYSRRTAIAQALQHGLLPPELPEVPGWSTAVLYRPAGEFNEVGGDFYDLFKGPDSWMLVVGDVAGKGAEAAVGTSLARFTLRTAARLTGDVGRAIEQLNATLRDQTGLPLCSVVCASLAERPDGAAALTLASAGHPPPLLVRGREVLPVGRPGTIAGAFDDESWPVETVELRSGDVLVLYTDGVLDFVGEQDRFGEERLRDALAASEGGAEQHLSALDAALRRFGQGAQRDDTTILVLEYRGEPPGAVAEDARMREAAS